MTHLVDGRIGETLERDAASFIALWLEIYGGDPPPEAVEVGAATSALVTGIVAQLRADFGAPALSDEELTVRLARRGLRLSDRLVEPGSEPRSAELRHGGFFCVKGPQGEPGCCVRIASFR
jgi:hypothetical protein